MEKQYLTLRNGQTVRVEVNWNAITNFSESIGLNNIAQLDQLAELKPKQFTGLIWHCVAEGEENDGRKFELNEKEFAKMIGIAEVTQFNKIYAAQTVPNDTLKKK